MTVGNRHIMVQTAPRLFSLITLVVAWTLMPMAGLHASGIEYRGNISLQAQGFMQSPQHTADHTINTSLSSEIELYRGFDTGYNSGLIFTPFLRVDQNDDERTQADIRELYYLMAGDTWEVRAGISRIFWGVAESRNVVDIINQTDQIEGVLSDAKLGQPMINVTSVRDWGNVDVFILPGFRERTFAGDEGRPRLPFTIDTDNALYESSDEDQHVDFALRYSTVVDVLDIGVSVFDGTSREPLFVPGPAGLQPLYYQVTQVGIDIQATLESWLLKLESVHRSGNLITDHAELVTGFEYSFYGVNESNLDIGVVAEYLWDERKRDATQTFQNDMLIGLRFALNDEQSTEALIGAVVDLDGQGNTFTAEASRRINDRVTFSAELFIQEDTDNDGIATAFGKEDFAQIELSYFF